MAILPPFTLSKRQQKKFYMSFRNNPPQDMIDVQPTSVITLPAVTLSAGANSPLWVPSGLFNFNNMELSDDKPESELSPVDKYIYPHLKYNHVIWI